MYSQGFSRTAGDDILSSLMKTSPPAAANNKSITFTASGHDDDDPFSYKRSQSSRPSGGDYGVGSRRHEENKKLADDVDDLLDLIQGGGGKPERTTSKPPLPGRTGGLGSPSKEMGSTGNKFYEEFGDEDNYSSYVPAARDSRSNKQNSDDLSKKRSHLFGLGEQSMTQTVRTSESIDQDFNAFRQRPQTSDPKPTTTDSGIGEITLSVSRRGARGKTAKDPNRPFTSPGILEKPESQFSEDRSASGTPLVKKKSRGVYDYEDENESDYLSGIGHRDRADSKKSLTTIGGGGGLNLDHETISRKDYLRADPAFDGTPKKSPLSEYGRREPNFAGSRGDLDDHKQEPYQRAATMNPRREYYDTASQLMSHNSQAGSITNLGGGGGGRRNRGEAGTSKGDSGAIRVEDDIANLVRNQVAPREGTTQNPTTGGSHNALGTPLRDASIMINEGENLRGGFMMHDTAGRDFARESEEYYKKRMKDAEEHYEKRYEDLKKALEEEKKKWEANYIKEIEQLKKEKDELKDSARVQVDRERDRLKEIFNLELESKEKLHKYELERQKHLMEEQNEGLKRQLEAQTRLNALADEVRTSSNKLMSLTERLDQDKNKDGQGKKNELSERERKLEEGELKLKHEQTMWEGEKKRLEKLRTEVEQRETETQKMIERERELIRREYHRLTELQDSIKDQEVEKRKKLEGEKKAWEQDKSRLEEENRKVKEEFTEKYKQMELEMEVFETQKNEFQELIDKSEAALRQKHEEVDNTRKRLTIQEAEILRRIKALDHKDLIYKKESEELQSKLGLLEIEKLSFEKERLEMKGIVDKAKDDMDIMNRFRREYEVEKDKNIKMKLEMESFARTMQNEREKIHEEKNSLSMMHKTLENLRFNYVKEFAVQQPKTLTQTNPIQETLFLGKENNGPLGNGFGLGGMRRYNNSISVSNTLGRSGSPVNGEKLGLEKPVNLQGTNTYKYTSSFKGLGQEEFRPKTTGSNFGKTVNELKDIGVSKLTIAKPFNYQGYMDQIKQYDQATSSNQNYIAMEKEGLMKNAIDYGSGSLLRIRSLGNTDSSLRSSPQFKGSIGLHKLDKVEDL